MARPGPYRWPAVLLRQWPLIVVLVVGSTGLVLVFVDGDYGRGTVVFASAVCLAAVLRAILPNGWAGMLRVRSRWTDVVTLAVLGAGCLLAALALINDWDADPLVRWFSAST